MEDKRRMKGLACLLNLFLGLIVASCQKDIFSSTVISPPTATPNFPPLKLAADFTEGYTSIPDGKHIFIEVKGEILHIGKCIGPQSVPPQYHYKYYDGTLSIDPYKAVSHPPYKQFVDGQDMMATFANAFENGPGLIGQFTQSRYETPNLGEISTDLYLINSLPYTLTTGQFPQVILHSLYSDGTVAAEIEENIYQIEPGQSWQKLADQTIDVKKMDFTRWWQIPGVWYKRPSAV